jgi:flagellar protein FliS
MTIQARRAYAAAQWQSAARERLRLMLIETAIAAVEEARSRAAVSHWAIAGESFVRSRRAVAELLASIRTDATGDAADLARRVRALYAYLFRELTDAQLYRDPRRLDDVLRVLSLERETWRQVCRQSGEATPCEQASDDECSTGLSFMA